MGVNESSEVHTRASGAPDILDKLFLEFAALVFTCRQEVARDNEEGAFVLLLEIDPEFISDASSLAFEQQLGRWIVIAIEGNTGVELFTGDHLDLKVVTVPLLDGHKSSLPADLLGGEDLPDELYEFRLT